MHPDEGADHFEVAQFLGADVEKKVAPRDVVHAIPTLDGVLHRGCEFAVSAAKLLQQHVSKPDIRRADLDRIHQLLNVVIHRFPPGLFGCGRCRRVVAQGTSDRETAGADG